MANLFANTHSEPNNTGVGNARHGQYTLDTAASGTITYMTTVPAGSIITGFRYVNGALGTSATMSFGYKTKSTTTDDAFYSEADVAAAGAAAWSGVPIHLTENASIIATLDNAASGGSSGQVDVVVEFVFNGTASSSYL